MQTIKKRANKKQTVFQFQFALHSQHDGSILLRLLTETRVLPIPKSCLQILPSYADIC